MGAKLLAFLVLRARLGKLDDAQVDKLQKNGHLSKPEAAMVKSKKKVKHAR